MADTSKITLGQLKAALTQAKNYTDNEIAIVTGVSKVEPEELDMPKVFFNGSKPTTKDDVYATIEYVSANEHFKGHVAIKCQGTSSMAYPKKNYTIKMFEDEARTIKMKKDFKGWGKQSKFCLKANYIDHSHARNVVSAKLWDEIVASRANYAELPELLKTSPRNGAVDGFPIKVYYNNTYEGVYTWNIPKDKWMFNMDDVLDNHCVLCGEEYVSGCFRSANASLWSDEIHDVMPESIKTSFNNFISFVMNSSDNEFKTNLENYVYVDSLIDYYIFQYVICGLDSMGKNQLFATYNGTKWIATSYDMDSTFGLYWNGLSFVSSEYKMQADYESGKNTSSNYNGEGNLLYVRLEQLFANEIKARYAELRSNVLSYANIVNKFERFMDVIGKDLFAEDLTIYTGIPSGDTNNIQQIRNYTRDRLVYVDAQIEILSPKVACTGISLDRSSLEFTSSDSQTLTATLTPSDCNEIVTWTTSDERIATVSNGVVTPVANGECRIIAACGGYSATCNVTVNAIITQYSITNNLSMCTNSNSSTRVTENAPYSATLTPNSGCSLNSVTITMNGVDITSTAYSNGNINISNVTGDIVITATAAPSSSSDMAVDGLVRYFDFANYTNDSSITEIVDKAGSGAVITLNGLDYTETSGFNNNLLVFDGTKASAVCEDFPIDTTNDFTLEIVSAHSTIVNAAFSERVGFGQWSPCVCGLGAYQLTWRDTSYANTLIEMGIPTYDASGKNFTAGTVVHRIYTWDSASRTMALHMEHSVNGEYAIKNAMQRTASKQLANMTKLYLGVKYDSSTYTQGKVGVVRLYNRKLTGEEIVKNIEYEKTISRG